MTTKQDAIRLFKEIQNGKSDIDRQNAVLATRRGSLAVERWEDGDWALAMEYGYMLALIECFGLTDEDLDEDLSESDVLAPQPKLPDYAIRYAVPFSQIRVDPIVPGKESLWRNGGWFLWDSGLWGKTSENEATLYAHHVARPDSVIGKAYSFEGNALVFELDSTSADGNIEGRVGADNRHEFTRSCGIETPDPNVRTVLMPNLHRQRRMFVDGKTVWVDIAE